MGWKRRWLLDGVAGALYTAPVFWPIEAALEGVHRANALRLEMGAASVLGLGAGYGIYREAWMLNFGITEKSSAPVRWAHEIGANATYFGSAYMLIQAANGSSAKDNALLTTLCSIAGLIVAPLYGRARDWTFHRCGEGAALSASDEKSSAARFLNLPLRDAYKVVTGHASLEDLTTTQPTQSVQPLSLEESL